MSVLGCGVAVGLVVSFGGGMRAGSTGNGGPDVFLFGVGLRR
ncbi:hypothetical protein [Bacillus paramycoides]|nr:hypothetical protein [Bacillus paramycoides]